jgi:hypothetical protein
VNDQEQASSLAQALLLPREQNTSLVCKFTRVKDAMSDEEKKALDRAVEMVRKDNGMGKGKVYSASWLTKVLKQHGYSVSISTIQRHVNGECCCEQPN